MDNLEYLIKIFELAKTCNQHWIANLIFAKLWFDYKKEFTVEIEKGVADHFDLVVLVKGECRLCIPVPLVSQKLLYRIARDAKFVPRMVHERVTRKANEQDKAQLLNFLKTNRRRIVQCCQVFNPDVKVNLLISKLDKSINKWKLL